MPLRNESGRADGAAQSLYTFRVAMSEDWQSFVDWDDLSDAAKDCWRQKAAASAD